MNNQAENKSKQSKGAKFFDYLRFGESYTSLILGIIVVIISTVLLLSFIHKKNVPNQKQETMSQQTNRNVPNLAQDSQSLSGTPVPTSVTDVPTLQATMTPTPTVVKKITPTAVPTKVAQAKPSATPAKAKSPVTPKPTKAIATATSKPATVKKPTPVPTRVAQKTVEKPIKGSNYTVVKGDTLWSIAEKKYKSGYNWVDIARANKLHSPSAIHAGNKLVLPEVAAKTATVKDVKKSDKKEVVQKNEKKSDEKVNKITGNAYTIVKGDTLWSIAVRAYGDGYQWKKIAEANKLVNPSLIHSGNKLKIPRTG